MYYVQIGLFPPTPTYPRMSEQLKEKYQFHETYIVQLCVRYPLHYFHKKAF